MLYIVNVKQILSTEYSFLLLLLHVTIYIQLPAVRRMQPITIFQYFQYTHVQLLQWSQVVHKDKQSKEVIDIKGKRQTDKNAMRQT